MPLSRLILDWTRPLCDTVPEWLLADARGLTDLRDTILVVPTRQSGWRLRGALPLAADARGVVLLSPAIISASVLLSPPPSPGIRVASELQSLLAWCAVLKGVTPGDCDAFLGSRQNDPSHTGWALQTARRLQSLRQELADGGLNIAEVAARGSRLVEADRWAAMAELERRHTARLAESGLQDGVTATLAHARTGKPPPGLRHVVLACVPDPPRLLLAMLDRWALENLQVTVLAAAAPDAATPEEGFDAWGCPRPEYWSTRPIDLDDRDLHLLATPEDQAGCVAEQIGKALSAAAPVPGQPPAIAVGAPDSETIAPLQRELESRGLTVFNPQNRPFPDTRLFRLLQALLAFRKRAGYAETAALLRHPDVLAAFGREADLLRALDTAQAACLPVTLDALLAHLGDTPLGRALRQCAAWRESLQSAPLASALRQVLQAVYAQRQLAVGDRDDEAFRQSADIVDAALRELDEADAAHSRDEAADALLTRLQGASLKPERQNEDLDLEGWLELAWNPAPLLFVTGMNEGLVPDGRMADVFLPDTLRRELALRDDRQRLARDAYLLGCLVAQRRSSGGRIILLAGRTSLAGDPLRPSRLLFRCPDERLVARVTALYRDVAPSRSASAFATSFRLSPARVPPADRSRTVLEHLSPTAFREYLQCPLRFYLKRVLGMKPLDDSAREPDALAFGNVIHDVLKAMAADAGKPWAWGDADRLGDWLMNALERRVTALYGRHPWLGVVLAREAAARRLQGFARSQVDWHAQGWSIVEGLQEVEKTCTLKGLRVTGRIDRIDRHTSGALCVLDYKTSDKAPGPVETHLGPWRDDDPLAEARLPAGPAKTKRDRRWIDLQLPLYREMLQASEAAPAVPGYVCLGAAPGETGFKLWDDYSPDLHDRAMACARAVVERIRDGVFWPPSALRGADDFKELLLADAEACMEPPPAWEDA